MDSGFYAACSGLIAKVRQLEVTANNIANVSTTAFKSRHLAFQSVLADAGSSLAPLNEAMNRYGVVTESSLNRSAGTLERTGNDLDVAIEGPGFLTIQAAPGIAYSRNGRLHVSSAGQLLDANGRAVLGEQGPIRVPPDSEISVSPDGTISAGGALVGKLRLVEFATAAKLEEQEPGVFVSESKPSTAKSSAIRQGFLESSNVSGIEAAVGLLAIQRHAEMLQRALSIFHSEFNRIATGELSRV